MRRHFHAADRHYWTGGAERRENLMVTSQGSTLVLKREGSEADELVVNADSRLPAKTGPVPDRLTVWPLDDGRYGLDATFQGASGFQRAEHHETDLIRRGVPHTFRQELDNAWTLRFGPLAAVEVAKALSAFVY